MGKHTKLATPAPLAGGFEQLPMADQVGQLARRNVVHLERLLSCVEVTLDAGEMTPALARESANVSRSICNVMAELRAQEKHQQDAVKAMSPKERDELVKAYVADLPKERRDEFRRLLDEQDEHESLL